MNRSASVGAEGSSTIHQGTQEQWVPFVHQVTGRQTSVLAVEPAGPANWLQPLLAMVHEHLENSDLGSLPQMRQPLWKSRF